MLVRQLIGPYAGGIVDMAYPDVLRAEANNTVIRLSVNDAAAHNAGADVKVEPSQPPKRRGGWPKGKARGPRILV